MYSMHSPDLNGVPDDFTEVGTTIYFASIIVVNLKLCMRTRWVAKPELNAEKETEWV